MVATFEVTPVRAEPGRVSARGGPAAARPGRPARPRGPARPRRPPAGALAMNASFASRSRAAASQPSASASSRSSRPRSSAPAPASVRRRPDRRLDLAAGTMTARSPGRGRPPRAPRGSGRDGAAGRGPAARSPAGAPRTSAPSVGGHVRPASPASRRPGASPSARALRSPPTRLDQRLDLALGGGVALPRRRASGRRSAAPDPLARCGSAAQSASVTNGMTGWSSRR